METITLNTSMGESRIFCYENAFIDNIINLTKNREIFLITDSNVYSIYKELIEKYFNCPRFILNAGEKNKSFNNLSLILKEMTNSGLKRNSLLIAFGGGVIGDIGGLAAGLYMRGIEAMQIPTTLLSQVDSSVGGKTAVNFNGVKNNIGIFYQPKNIICDSVFLNTLPKREIKCGLGEIIKTAALNTEVFNILYKNIDKLNNLDFIKTIIIPCIKHKANVVECDEKETDGIRKTLNLGHTTGHALEINYKKKSHGEYVMIGMLFEIYIAKKKNLIDNEYADKLEKLIKVIEKKPKKYDGIETALKSALLDKKNTLKNKIAIIIPQNYGKVTEINLEFDEYETLIGEYNEN
jgi:3-dehydroquinate synthase